jgi:polyisoprenoid-binding protein YceI
VKLWNGLVPAALAVVGCHLCSRDDVKPVRPPTPASDVRLPAGAISVSPANSTIEFTGSTTLTSHTGHFEAFDGTLEVPTDDPKDLKIRVVVTMDSTTTKIGLLTKHLKDDDFFDVARYPTSQFVLDRIIPSGETGQYRVSGKLTLHGVERSVEFPARIAITPEAVTFAAAMTVRQSEFGMTEAAKKTKDDVPVTITIRASRRATGSG